MIDLLRVAKTFLGDTQIPKAHLRAIEGGIRYDSPIVVLDFFRDGIVLRDAKRLSPDKTYRLLKAIRHVIRDLGFLPSVIEGLQELPSPGAVIAAHPTFLKGNVSAPAPDGKEAEDEAANVIEPLHADNDPAIQEDEPENIQENEGPSMSM